MNRFSNGDDRMREKGGLKN